jgi:hypothetical protein
MPWCIVEMTSVETGDLHTHILPCAKVEPFATEEEALAFLVKCENAGDPVLTDANDNVTETYFGHTLSPKCVCDPKQSAIDSRLYIHRAAN